MTGSSKGFWETGSGILTALAGIITAVTGLLVALHQLGVLGAGEAPPREAAVEAPPVEREERPAVADAAPGSGRSALVAEAGPEPSAPPDLSGYWRDATGTVYEIVHTGGNGYRFSALNSFSGYAAQGHGTLEGRRFRNEFETNLPSTGSGTGTVSEDGRLIEGTFFDSVLGRYSLAIYR